MSSLRALFLLVVVNPWMFAAANAQSGPADAPDDWLLAFVDIETTGLIPGYHEMIDIGIVLTDLDGIEINSMFVRIQPEHPERTGPCRR